MQVKQVIASYENYTNQMLNSQAQNKDLGSQNSSITRQPKESTKRSGTTGGTASGAAHKKALLARSMQKEPES